MGGTLGFKIQTESQATKNGSKLILHSLAVHHGQNGIFAQPRVVVEINSENDIRPTEIPKGNLVTASKTN